MKRAILVSASVHILVFLFLVFVTSPDASLPPPIPGGPGDERDSRGRPAGRSARRTGFGNGGATTKWKKLPTPRKR